MALDVELLAVERKKTTKAKSHNFIHHLLLFILLLSLLVSPVSAAWWKTSWQYRVDNAIAAGVRPYVLELNITNSTGVNNATHIFFNGHANANYTDIRTTLDNTTELPHWIEDNKIYINLTANGTVNIYYGNPSATSASNGITTFDFFDDAETGYFSDKWLNVFGTGGSYATDNAYSGVRSIKNGGQGTVIASISKDYTDAVFEAKFLDTCGSLFGAKVASSTNTLYGYRPNSSGTGKAELYLFLNNTAKLLSSMTVSDDCKIWSTLKIITNGSRITTYYNGSLRFTATDINIISGRVGSRTGGGAPNNMWMDNVRVYKYASPEPSWTTWGTETTKKAPGFEIITTIIILSAVYILRQKRR